MHYVVISNTNQNFCFDFASCLSTVKDHHLEEISSENITICNFFVGGEGTVFEDLGWGNVNMLTGLVAENSVEICLMGNMVDYPTFSQLEAAKNLIQMGVSNGYVARNYVLLPSNSTSPDREISPFLYTTIQKWPKFRESPKKISGAFN